MSTRTNRTLYALLLTVCVGVGTFALLADANTRELLTWGFLWERVARPLVRLSFFISLGLFAGQVIEAAGWADKVGIMARPLMRWGRLSSHLGAAFTTAFVSGTASLSMLASFHRDGVLDRRGLTLGVLLNTFPSYFLHLPTTFFLLLPLVGRAGVIYLGVTFGAALLRLICVVLYSRLCRCTEDPVHGPERTTQKAWGDMLRRTAGRFKSRIGRVLAVVLPVYLVIALASHAGFFVWLRRAVAGLFTTTVVPVEAMGVVIFTLAAEFTSGYAAAGAMLDSGALTVFQTVLALLAGNVLAAPIRALRHQMPYYMGIFSPAAGVRLMVMSQALRVGSLLVAGAIFVLAAGR